MRFILIKLSLLAIAVGVCASPTLAAETVTAELNVSAEVVDTCVFTSVSPLGFATIDTTKDTTETSIGSVEIACTSGHTGVSVTLDGGENASGGVRSMISSATDTVPYKVYTQANHTGEIAIDGNAWSGNLIAAVAQTISVYGMVPKGNYLLGTYADTITVTMNY
ncbi:spore coat U domain-containing protein [Thioclava indica]|uniref:Spore coat protein U/FanG domain-containing protein n=1 Tax=Thioclava indica TaxID=1353528 RepID=A0A074JXE3_9RHOB|nr:spore coat protein U domain-containing protein [Thioclava indica]KEO60253.1 hypothetical protein DT23_13555 [Thioclava indica]